MAQCSSETCLRMSGNECTCQQRAMTSCSVESGGGQTYELRSTVTSMLQGNHWSRSLWRGVLHELAANQLSQCTNVLVYCLNVLE